MSRRVALVTGASRGIGRAIADHLAGRQHDVVMVARDPERLATAAAELRAVHQVTVATVALDLCDLPTAARALADAVDRLGRLDVLVNSAGIFRFGTSGTAVDDMAALLTTNMLAVHNVCRACLDALRRADDARIFNIASIAGIEPFAPVGGYAASKYALVGYSRSLARELLAEGIKVTVLCPDVVDTDMAAGSGMRPEEMIAPADVARAVEFVMGLSPATVVEQLVIGCKPPVDGVRASA